MRGTAELNRKIAAGGLGVHAVGAMSAATAAGSPASNNPATGAAPTLANYTTPRSGQHPGAGAGKGLDRRDSNEGRVSTGAAPTTVGTVVIAATLTTAATRGSKANSGAVRLTPRWGRARPVTPSPPEGAAGHFVCTLAPEDSASAQRL